jgi:ribonucleoside-diphosphate reductase subunit M2
MVDRSATVSTKSAWCLERINDRSLSFATHLLVYIIAQGIFSSSTTGAIYWFQLGGTMPGFCHSNELIYRDECIYVEFACLLFNRLDDKPSNERIKSMILEAVFIEKEFLLGMPSPS